VPIGEIEMMNEDELNAHFAELKAKDEAELKRRHNVIVSAYLVYFNYYADILIDNEAELIKECDIAPQFNSIDESGNAIHCYLCFDTCDIDIIAFFDDKGYMQDIRISQDTMPYEMMICDLTRK